MSRSHRHFPLFSFVVGGSQAEWKRSYNRVLRRCVRQRLAARWHDEDLVMPTIDEMADPWGSPCDDIGHYTPFRSGRGWWGWNSPGVPERFAHYKAVFMK